MADDPCGCIAEMLRPRVGGKDFAGVTFLTDVEGNWEFLLAWVEHNQHVMLAKLHPDGSADLVIRLRWRFMRQRRRRWGLHPDGEHARALQGEVS